LILAVDVFQMTPDEDRTNNFALFPFMRKCDLKPHMYDNGYGDDGSDSGDMEEGSASGEMEDMEDEDDEDMKKYKIMVGSEEMCWALPSYKSMGKI